MGNGDFQPEDLDSFENVIGLSPRDPLNGFAGTLYKIFKTTYCSFGSTSEGLRKGISAYKSFPCKNDFET